jgi:hypothetical protein
MIQLAAIKPAMLAELLSISIDTLSKTLSVLKINAIKVSDFNHLQQFRNELLFILRD